MTQEEALGILVGVIFAILGLALLTRYKKLSSHNYFRILIIFIAVLLICFGVYTAINVFYWNV